MAMINNPNTKVSKTLLDSWIDVIQKATPKSTGGTKIPDLGRKLPDLARRMPSKGIMMRHPYLNALLSGYGIGTVLDNQLGLSDMLSEWLIQDPDMSGVTDWYPGETEASVEDLQRLVNPRMNLINQERLKWK